MEYLNTAFQFVLENWIGITFLIFVLIMISQLSSFHHQQEKEEDESYEKPKALGEDYCGKMLEVYRIEKNKILLWVEIYDPSYPLIPKKLWFLKDGIPKELQNEKTCFKMVNSENGFEFIDLSKEDSLTVKRQKYYATYTIIN